MSPLRRPSRGLGLVLQEDLLKVKAGIHVQITEACSAS